MTQDSQYDFQRHRKSSLMFRGRGMQEGSHYVVLSHFAFVGAAVGGKCLLKVLLLVQILTE